MKRRKHDNGQKQQSRNRESNWKSFGQRPKEKQSVKRSHELKWKRNEAKAQEYVYVAKWKTDTASERIHSAKGKQYRKEKRTEGGKWIVGHYVAEQQQQQ